MKRGKKKRALETTELSGQALEDWFQVFTKRRGERKREYKCVKEESRNDWLGFIKIKL